MLLRFFVKRVLLAGATVFHEFNTHLTELFLILMAVMRDFFALRTLKFDEIIL